MKSEEIETIMRAVATVVREQLKDQIEAVQKSSQEAIRALVKAELSNLVPADVSRDELQRVVVDELSKLPAPHNGSDGRDALDIDVRDGINPDRPYPAGTYASYRGGMIKAYRSTDPLGPDLDVRRAGWQVLANGIAEEQETQLDEGRELQRITVYTDGLRSIRTHKRRAMIYRGVYKKGQAYEGGDVATYGGSLWICNTSSPTKLGPTEGSFWTLCVKRGRDGSKAE